MSVVGPIKEEDDRVVTALLELKYPNTAVVGPSSQKELTEQVAVLLPDIKDKTKKISPARPDKRRNRKSVTCNYCKGAKIKCNKKLPCDQCVKRGISETCAIFNRKAPTKGFQEFYLPRLVNKKRKRLSDNDNVFKNTKKCTRSLNCTRPFSHVGICKSI